MTADIKNSVCNGEIEWRIEMSEEWWQRVHSTLEVDVPMDEAMKWLEAFNFNSQDFFEAVHINDEAVHINDKNVSVVFTSMSGIGTGSRCVTLEFSLLSYSIPNVESDVIDFWDKFVEKTVDSIRCAVVEHELKSCIG